MPPSVRRQRASLPNAFDDVSTLTLSEVRARLDRNERVLNTSIFSPTSPQSSPGPSLSTSPTSPFASTLGPASPPDPLRDRLLAVRQHLLARQQELCKDDGSPNGGSVSSPGHAESSSSALRRGEDGVISAVGGKSGKMRAMEAIKVEDEKRRGNSMILPMAESLALGQRDHDNATAQRLSAMTIEPKPPPDTPPKSKRRQRHLPDPRRLDYDPADEIARAQATARMRNFMSFREDEAQEDEHILDDAFGMEGEYDGDGDTFRLEAQGREPHRHEKGTGEEVDEFGEDDEEWAEGNDDYLDRVR